MALDIGKERKKTKCDKQVAKLLNSRRSFQAGGGRSRRFRRQAGMVAEIGGRSGLGP